MSDYTTVTVTFHDSSRRYTYKVLREMGLKPDDIAIVPARDWWAVVTVDEVHNEPTVPDWIENGMDGLKAVHSKLEGSK